MNFRPTVKQSLSSNVCIPKWSNILHHCVCIHLSWKVSILKISITELAIVSSWNLFQCSWYCNPVCSIENVTLANLTQLAKLSLYTASDFEKLTQLAKLCLYRTPNRCSLLKLNSPSPQQCLRAFKSLMRWPSQFSHLPHNLIHRSFVKLAARGQLLHEKEIFMNA